MLLPYSKLALSQRFVCFGRLVNAFSMNFGIYLSSVVTSKPEIMTKTTATTFVVVTLSSPKIKEVQITESTGEIYTSGAIFEASSLDRA